MKTVKKHFIFFTLFLCMHAHASDESCQQPEFRVVPLSPVPVQQIMQDTDFVDDPVNIKQQNRGKTLTMRLAQARQDIAHDSGLFQTRESTCGQRAQDMRQFSRYYAAELFRHCMSKNCCALGLLCPCVLVGTVGAGIGDAASMAAQSPVATAYVWCDAECARRYYRSRYEARTLSDLGVALLKK